jgi:hypothetical protein
VELDLPDSAFEVLAFVALVVPGLVYATTRSRLRGYLEGDRSVASRIVQALVVSVLLDAVYFVVLAGPLEDAEPHPVHYLLTNALAISATYFLCAAIIPLVLAWLIHGDVPFLRPVYRLATQLRSRLTSSNYQAVPNAWDYATTTAPAGWVRVRIAPGQWVGGRFADGSYFSTYPEPRDLFIEDQYVVKEDGSFGERVPSSSGVWLSIRDDYVVEWLADEPGQE